MSARAAIALAAALGGCGASQPLPEVVSPSGPCIQETATGQHRHRHYRYWRNGVEINATNLHDAVASAVSDFAPARDELARGDRVERAGWGLFSVGIAAFVAGLISALTVSTPVPPGQKRGVWLPGFGIQFGGEAFAAASLFAGTTVAEQKLQHAIALYNAHADEVGCR